MSKWDRRLETLEQQSDEGQSLRLVFLSYGETEDEAIARTGADRTNTLFVGWKSPDQPAAKSAQRSRQEGTS